MTNKKVNIISMGNSIASGFSAIDGIKPLSFRIAEKMQDDNIDFYDLALAADNADKHTFEYVVGNQSFEEYYKLIHANYFGIHRMLKEVNIDEETFGMYYSNLLNGDNINDILLRQDSDNVIVYCGATGKFLDHISRNGSLNPFDLQKFVVEDIYYIRALYNYINMCNRNGRCIQVYLLALPNILGINITNIINKELRKLAIMFPNVTYVEPENCKFVYPRSKYLFDVHYNDAEYDLLVDNIIKKINATSFSQKIKIQLDALINKHTMSLRLNGKPLEFMELLKDIDDIFQIYDISEEEKKYILDQFNKYFKSKFPSEFYYLGNKNLIDDTRKILLRK